MMPRLSAQRGFTLLELLVAFAIMALSLGMLYRAAGGGARSVGDVERYQRAVVLAQSLLALRDSVPPQGWNESGQTEGFNWQIRSAPYGSRADVPAAIPLHEVQLSILWNDGERGRRLELSTLLPQRKPLEPGQRP